MKKAALIIICLLGLHNVKAQNVQDSIKEAVNNLFIAMATSDSLGIVKSFTPDGVLQSVAEKDGNTSVVNEKIYDFAHVIAGLQKYDADERITFKNILVDGALAFAWTPYNFYYKGKFSHCGVDCFCLVRINGAWKIQYLIDTRRNAGCRN